MRYIILCLAVLFAYCFVAIPVRADTQILRVPAQSKSEMVLYNTKTHKFHKPSCYYAKKCTVNCIQIPKADAISRGGVPCKICGG